MKREVKFAGNPLPLSGNGIQVGDKAPNFTALNTALQPVSLADHKGKLRIISVFPSVDTSVCSLQTRRFNAEAKALGDAVQVFTISNDLPFALGRFCGAENIENLIPLSDHRDQEFGKAYGFLLEPLRLLARGVVVIDKDDTIRYVEYVPEVTTEPNYEAALAVVKQLL